MVLQAEPLTTSNSKEVVIPVGEIQLEGMLTVPEGAKGLVVFSHGSGSSRFSRRNNMVAGKLNEASMATLLFDLLTAEEDEIYEYRFNIELLTDRIVEVTKWLFENEDTCDFQLAYFGASTGAASALNAAAILGDKIRSVVSRGGRPDLSMEYLDKVKSPVLLIVGGLDSPVIGMNEEAFEKLECEKKMVIIPGATHLFEESGKLEEVANLSTEWFALHFK